MKRLFLAFFEENYLDIHGRIQERMKVHPLLPNIITNREKTSFFRVYWEKLVAVLGINQDISVLNEFPLLQTPFRGLCQYLFRKNFISTDVRAK